MPARFTFRFESILRVRKQREDAKKRQVAARLRQIDAIRRRQADLERTLGEHQNLLRAALRDSTLDVDQVRWERHWLSHLRRGVLEASAELTAERALLAQERVELVEARKESEVMARLKERRREAYLAEAARAEQIETDEMNLSRLYVPPPTEQGATT